MTKVPVGCREGSSEQRFYVFIFPGMEKGQVGVPLLCYTFNPTLLFMDVQEYFLAIPVQKTQLPLVIVDLLCDEQSCW